MASASGHQIPTTRAAAEHHLLQHVARTEAALERSAAAEAKAPVMLVPKTAVASLSSVWEPDSEDLAALDIRSPALPRWPESPIGPGSIAPNGSASPEFDQRVDTVRSRLARLSLPTLPELRAQAVRKDPPELQSLLAELEREREELAEECQALKLSLWEASQLRAEEDGKERVLRERDELGEEVAALTSSLSEVQTHTDELRSQNQELRRLRAEASSEVVEPGMDRLEQKEAEIKALKQRLRQTHLVAEEAAEAQAEADEQMDAHFRHMEVTLEGEMEEVAEVGLEVEEQCLRKVEKLEEELAAHQATEGRDADAALQAKVQQLNSELVEERRIRAQLVATQGAAEELETEVRETLIAMQAKNQQLQSELLDERKVIAHEGQLKEQLLSSQAKNQQLQSELLDERKVIAHQGQLKEQLLSSQADLGRLQTEVQQTLAAMEAQARQLQSESSRESLLRGELQTSEEHLRRLKGELAEASEGPSKAQQARAQEEHGQLEMRLDRVEARARQVETELHSEQQGKARRLREELAEELQVQQQLAAAEERARRLEAELQRQAPQLAAAQAKVRQLQSQLQEEGQAKQRLAAAEARLGSLRSELHQEQEQRTAAQGKARRLSAELGEEEALREQLGSAQAKLRQLRSELQEAEELLQRLSAAEASLQRAHGQRQQEQEKLLACEGSLQKLRLELGEEQATKQRLAVTEGSLEQLQSQLRREQEQLASAEGSARRGREELKEEHQLRQQLEAAEGSLKQLQAQQLQAHEGLLAAEGRASRSAALELAQAETGFEMREQELLQSLELLHEELKREQQAGKLIASQRMAAAKVQAEVSVLRSEQEVAQSAWSELSEQQAEMLLALQSLAAQPKALPDLEAELRAERLRFRDLASAEVELAQDLLDLRCNLELRSAALASRRSPSPPRRGRLARAPAAHAHAEVPRARSEGFSRRRLWSADAELQALEKALRQVEAATELALASSAQDAKDAALRAGTLAAEERARSLRAAGEEAACNRALREELRVEAEEVTAMQGRGELQQKELRLEAEEVTALRGRGQLQQEALSSEVEAQRGELARLRDELRSQPPTSAAPTPGRSAWRTSWVQAATPDLAERLRDQQIVALKTELQEAKPRSDSSSSEESGELWPWEEQLRMRLEDAAGAGGLRLDMETLEVQSMAALRFGEASFADETAATRALQSAAALLDAFGVEVEVTLAAPKGSSEARLRARNIQLKEAAARNGLDLSRFLIREQWEGAEERVSMRLRLKEVKASGAALATAAPPARSWRLSWAQGA